MGARRKAPFFLFSNTVPAPSYVLDLEQLEENCRILNDVQKRSQVKILLALKAFAAFSVFPGLSRSHFGVLHGTCASSLNEARLGREQFGGEVHVFAAAFRPDEFSEILQFADHITFNSLAQWRRYAEEIRRSKRKISCGLRINPEHSEGSHALYDPCHETSRLGIRRRDFDGTVFEEGITGLHFHTLCEQNADALARTMDACEEKFGSYLARSSFINLGGGHHITRADYQRDLLVRLLNQWERKYKAQLYLEPGEAVALDAGWLTATVLDIVRADRDTAILDVSVTCHMPDVLEMPYRPPVFYCEGDEVREAEEEECGHVYRLAGPSCLAGDVVPYFYSFSHPLRVGDRLIFGDMAIYTMVKNSTFNGINLPCISLFRDGEITVVRRFGYEDFKSRLS